MTLRLGFKITIALAPALAVMLVWAVQPAGAQTAKSAAGWKAGLAKVVITPERPVWMAGYASRNKPSEGKIQDLYAKALALEDAQGNRVVLVTSDLIGFPRAIAEAIADRVQRQF